MPIRDHYSGTYFGGQDAQRAIDAGYTVDQVQDFVDANQGAVHQDNQGRSVGTWGISTVEGGGGENAGTVGASGSTGLGGSHSSGGGGQGALTVEQPQQVDYGQMFADMQAAFTTQMQEYQSQQTQWQQQQSALQQQQRQEQMRIEQQRHQEMMAAQNRVTTSTATSVKQPGSPLAIQPSVGGAAQSAADLGRKPTPNKPVVSGLNIGLQQGRPPSPVHHGIK